MDVVVVGVVVITLTFSAFYVLAMYRARERWRESQRHIQDLQALDMQRTAHINVLYAQLSAMGHLASSSLGSDPHPYRVDPARLAAALERVCHLSEETLSKNFREVGHFRTLGDATMFLDTLGPGSRPYVLPVRMWDGDCYHVIYSTLPELILPPGVKVIE